MAVVPLTASTYSCKSSQMLADIQRKLSYACITREGTAGDKLLNFSVQMPAEIPNFEIVSKPHKEKTYNTGSVCNHTTELNTIPKKHCLILLKMLHKFSSLHSFKTVKQNISSLWFASSYACTSTKFTNTAHTMQQGFKTDVGLLNTVKTDNSTEHRQQILWAELTILLTSMQLYYLQS